MSDSQQRGAVLVTGATGGIGAATVRALTSRGYEVYAGVRGDASALDGAAGVRVVKLDVTEPGSVAAAAKQISQQVGSRGLRAVVNNAGVIVQGPLELVPADELRRQFDVNTLGPVFVVQEFLPLVRAGAGRIVNVSAPTGRIAVPFLAPLSGSKAALEFLSSALRLELAAWKIPVVVVEPGSTSTSIFAKAGEAEKEAQSRVDQDRLALYRAHLAGVAKASGRVTPGPIDKVAEAIVKAVETRRPKRRYVVGDARLFSVLLRLPVRLRESVVVAAFGLRGVTVDSLR
jgi:NAD(P)-dependent dehydrogenase (short-subunit alcohol dehydrogenase family)